MTKHTCLQPDCPIETPPSKFGLYCNRQYILNIPTSRTATHIGTQYNSYCKQCNDTKPTLPCPTDDCIRPTHIDTPDTCYLYKPKHNLPTTKRKRNIKTLEPNTPTNRECNNNGCIKDHYIDTPCEYKCAIETCFEPTTNDYHSDYCNQHAYET